MASKYLQKFQIPSEFPDMLHDFAREVLRNQPKDIHHFGACYFKAMEEVSPFSLTILGRGIRLQWCQRNCGSP